MIRLVCAAMKASVVVGAEAMKGGLWCSPVAKTSSPTSSAFLAIATVALMRSCSDGVRPVVGAVVRSPTVKMPNCMRDSRSWLFKIQLYEPPCAPVHSPGPEALLRLVAGVTADAVGLGDVVVHQVCEEPLVGVLEVVAVIHPDARVVGHESDVVGLTVLDVEGVEPPGAAGGLHAVAGQDYRVVPVQVHRVHVPAAVGDPHPHHVALADDVHRDVREEVAVPRPEQPRHALDETRAAADGVAERAVGAPGVEADRCGEP